MIWIENIGDYAYKYFIGIKEQVSLFTEAIYWSTFGRFNKNAISMKGTVSQMNRLGGDAFPIVTILTFLIGLTIAYQSAVQLKLLGGEIYLARGIGISMFSEIGPLLTAIIIAGRSGSAITAEIASMVVNDEVKSLYAMGINPVAYLVVPRFLAMTFAVPLLTYAAVISGILAGLIIASLLAQIPLTIYISELRNGVPTYLIWQCAVKSIVFSWIICVVACHKGLIAKGGADAVGAATTLCVVNSIAAVIVADAVFSFLFY